MPINSLITQQIAGITISYMIEKKAVTLQLNQQFKVLSRDGKLICAEIAGSIRPLAIHEPDLLMLSLFFKEKSINTAAHEFISHSWVNKWLPFAQHHDVVQRIQFFLDKKILCQAFDTPSTIEPVEIQITNKVDIELPEKLMLGRNLAISFSSDGFFSFSSQDQIQQLLPLSWVLLLMFFANGKTTQQAIDEQGYLFDQDQDNEKIILTLYSHGWLIKHRDPMVKETNVNLPEKVAVDPSHKGISWQEIDYDGRIPVYFVPHTADHFPLALGVIYSALENYKDGALLEKFILIPITFLKAQDMLDGPYNKFGAGVWLFSNYMWSLELNLQISNAIKKHDDKNLTIHGGPSTPEYKQASEDFLKSYPSVDIMVHGEGEVTITEVFALLNKSAVGQVVFNQLLLSEVPGITFRDVEPNAAIRTAGRARMNAPDSIPSPYLTGIFDVYQGRVEAAIIESNRGCPFGCTFCDWGSATNQKVRKFDLDRVKDEIDWIGKNNVRVIWIADANFGMYDRDIELAEYIVATKNKYGFPQEVVVNYTKNSTWRLVEIIKIFTAGGIISQGIISIQTTDQDTLKVINRQNIKTEKYDELTKVFSDLKLPLSTDLMIGLPGITVNAFKNDLQRYMEMDVSVKAYPTQLLPNSPMADPEYLAKYQIETDESDFIISCSSFTESDLQLMKGLYRIYMMADGFSLLRYVLRYLQWEHQIRAVDFLHDLLLFIRKYPTKFQQLTYAVRFFNQEKSMPGGWSLFYHQLKAYILDTYQINAGSGLLTAMKVNQACMPDDSQKYPIKINLSHDFSAYFMAKTNGAEYDDKPLTDYPAAKFHVSDPNSMVSIDLDYLQYDSHQYFWELDSAVARPKSISEYADT